MRQEKVSMLRGPAHMRQGNADRLVQRVHVAWYGLVHPSSLQLSLPTSLPTPKTVASSTQGTQHVQATSKEVKIKLNQT